MDSIKLSISKPPVYGYLHHAFPLAIMSSHDYFSPWLHSNYIQLYCAKNFEDLACPFNFYLYQDFNNFNLLECSRINREVLLSVTNILDFTINSIKQGYHVLLFLNEFFIPNRRAYNRKDYNHDLLISGYDIDKNIFNVSTYINKRFSEFTITFNEFVDAYTYTNYNCNDYAGIIHLLKNNTKIKYPFNLGQTIESLENYLESKNTFRNSFFPFQDWLAFGLNVYDYLIHELIKLADGNSNRFDIRPIHILWEHKKCMLSRLIYLEENGYVRSCGYYVEYLPIEKTINNLRLLLLKYQTTKQTTIVHTIVVRLKEVQGMEQIILNNLLKELRENQIPSSIKSLTRH